MNTKQGVGSKHTKEVMAVKRGKEYTREGNDLINLTDTLTNSVPGTITEAKYQVR